MHTIIILEHFISTVLCNPELSSAEFVTMECKCFDIYFTNTRVLKSVTNNKFMLHIHTSHPISLIPHALIGSSQLWFSTQGQEILNENYHKFCNPSTQMTSISFNIPRNSSLAIMCHVDAIWPSQLRGNLPTYLYTTWCYSPGWALVSSTTSLRRNISNYKFHHFILHIIRRWLCLHT
jgi:hypothetical protein